MTGPRAGRFLGLLAALLAPFPPAGAGPGGAEPPGVESQVKSAFIYNFARFVEWPPSAFASPDTPLAICTIDDGRTSLALERAVKEKTVGGRRLVVRRLAGDDPADGCHVLFIGAREEWRFAGVPNKLGGRPVLTVGEVPDFAARGGIIGFFSVEGRIRFQVNVDAAERANLKLSSRLLGVASVFREPARTGRTK